MTYYEITLHMVRNGKELNLRFSDQANAYLIREYIVASHENNEIGRKEKVIERFIKLFGDGKRYKIPTVFSESIQFFDHDYFDDWHEDNAAEFLSDDI